MTDEPVLRTGRLVLRELRPDDLDFVAEMLDHPEVMRYYPRHHTRAEARLWIERQRQRYALDGHGLWLALAAPGGTPVGQVGLVRQRVDGRLEDEIGYLLHRPFWGRGYASEAAAAVRDWAFATPGRERVVSLIRPANGPSQRVARRIGMQPLRRTLHFDMTHVVFGLARRDGK